MPTSLIIVMIDHESYASEESKELTAETLREYGRQVGEDAVSIYGCEGYNTVFNVSPKLLGKIADVGSARNEV